MKTLSKYLEVNFFLYLMCIALPTFLTNTVEDFDIMDYKQNVETMYVLWACMSLMYVLVSDGFSKTIDYISDNCDDFTIFKIITVVYVCSFGMLYLAGFSLLFQYMYL